MATVVNINSVAKITSGLIIGDLLTKEANTCSFNFDETYGNRPSEGQEVEVVKDGTKIFEGRITAIQSDKLSGNDFTFTIECTDWQVDLDNKMAVQTYTDKTLYYIVNDLVTKYCTGFTVTNVENPGATIDRVQFNYQYISECFEALADQTGYDWYVDYDKDIHFFPIETNDAPYELLDNDTDFDNLIITPDNTQIANKIWVRGGWYKSANYPQDTITAVAGQTEFPIRYESHDLTVTVNGVPKTVGIEFTDDAGGHDFLLNANENLLKVDTIVMSGAEAVIMTYKYEIPILAMVQSTQSQIILKAAEGGGDGIKEKYIKDAKIKTLIQAEEVGNAELLKFAYQLVEGSFTSHLAGWRTGQRVHIDLTDRSIDEYYMIREVTIEAIGGDELIYHVTFATLKQGFTWLLIKILDELKKGEIRTDEILYELAVIDTTVAITSDTPTIEQYTPPFEYGPGGSPQGVYNESQYG